MYVLDCGMKLQCVERQREHAKASGFKPRTSSLWGYKAWNSSQKFFLSFKFVSLNLCQVHKVILSHILTKGIFFSMLKYNDSGIFKTCCVWSEHKDWNDWSLYATEQGRFLFLFFSFPMNHLIYRCSKVVTTASLHAAYYQMLVVSSPQSFLCLFLIIMHSQCTKTRPTNDQPDVFVSEHFACNCCSRRAIKFSFSWGFPQLFSFKTLMF